MYLVVVKKFVRVKNYIQISNKKSKLQKKIHTLYIIKQLTHFD